MTLDELNNVDDFRQVVRANYDLTTFIPNPESEIARHSAVSVHYDRQGALRDHST